jgi:hypothetical protein
MGVPGLAHQSHGQEYTKRLSEMKEIGEIFITKMFLHPECADHFCNKARGAVFLRRKVVLTKGTSQVQDGAPGWVFG